LDEFFDCCRLGPPKVDKSFVKQNFENDFMINGAEQFPINH
jgi:hypothetical protein